MASGKLLALFFTFLILVCCLLAPCTEARKVLCEESAKRSTSTSTSTSTAPHSLDASLFLSALPKGKVPPSGPSGKGHAMVVDQKLLAMHFAKIDRILKSVPSPGMGH